MFHGLRGDGSKEQQQYTVHGVAFKQEVVEKTKHARAANYPTIGQLIFKHLGNSMYNVHQLYSKPS